jgi:hypothetical protein
MQLTKKQIILGSIVAVIIILAIVLPIVLTHHDSHGESWICNDKYDECQKCDHSDCEFDSLSNCKIMCYKPPACSPAFPTMGSCPTSQVCKDGKCVKGDPPSLPTPSSHKLNGKILFGADWCPHTQAAIKALGGQSALPSKGITYINCPAHQDICKRSDINITQYPTFKTCSNGTCTSADYAFDLANGQPLGHSHPRYS